MKNGPSLIKKKKKKTCMRKICTFFFSLSYLLIGLKYSRRIRYKRFQIRRFNAVVCFFFWYFYAG